nr:HNH endonuclease signature motif containing protein [Geodermatophilus sabuli]
MHTVLDALAGHDLHALSDGALLDRTAVLVAGRNRLDAELTRTVRAADTRQAAEHDGLKSMQSWLRGHARLSTAEAGRILRAGRALEALPAVAAAFAAGTITAEQVTVVVPVTTPERLAAAADQSVDVAEVDAVLAATAASRQPVQLARVVGHYLTRLAPDGIEPDPTEGRALTLARHPDGSLSVRGELDTVGGEKLAAALESLVQAGRCAGDRRTRAQTLGDALVQLADTALASGRLPVLRTVKPHVVLTIDLADLADPAIGAGAAGIGAGVAETGFGATLSAARARWLACDATITRLVLDPDGLPLDVGRTARVVPPHLRRAVEHRDRHCVFTGCTAPTHWCDVHHLLEWINGGATSLDNSALLCERHHTKVHHGYRIERQPDGRWRTWRPDGTQIHLHPDRLAA